MAYNFLPVERDQSFLLPPSMTDWLPEDHLAFFVLDVVENMDLRPFYLGYRQDGWGGAAHEPRMMVALLLYAYCVGERSSRKIERRCEEDIAFRVICANNSPDHTTIARFRRQKPPDCGLGAHEFPSRSVRRPALEAENKPNLQCVGQSLERFHARLVATALDTGDRRVAGADALSQLLLGDPQSGAMPDHQPGKFLELGKTFLFSAVGSALTRTPGSRLGGRGADGTLPRHASSFCPVTLPLLISHGKTRLRAHHAQPPAEACASRPPSGP